MLLFAQATVYRLQAALSAVFGISGGEGLNITLDHQPNALFTYLVLYGTAGLSLFTLMLIRSKGKDVPSLADVERQRQVRRALHLVWSELIWIRDRLRVARESGHYWNPRNTRVGRAQEKEDALRLLSEEAGFGDVADRAEYAYQRVNPIVMYVQAQTKQGHTAQVRPEDSLEEVLLLVEPVVDDLERLRAERAC